MGREFTNVEIEVNLMVAIIKIKLKMLSCIAFFSEYCFLHISPKVAREFNPHFVRNLFQATSHTPTFVAICSMTITDSNGCLISLIILLVGKMTFITRICCLFHI